MLDFSERMRTTMMCTYSEKYPENANEDEGRRVEGVILKLETDGGIVAVESAEGRRDLAQVQQGHQDQDWKGRKPEAAPLKATSKHALFQVTIYFIY